MTTPTDDLPLTQVLTTVLAAAVDPTSDRHHLLAVVVPLRPRPVPCGPDRPHAA